MTRSGHWLNTLNQRFGMVFSLRAISFQLLAVVTLLMSQSASLAIGEESDDKSEVVEELLETVEQITRSSWQECPYLGLRVKPTPINAGEDSGWVLIIFDVSNSGIVMNAEVIESNLGTDRQREALNVVELFRFRPVIRGDQVLVFENWVERVDFLREGEDPNPSWPQPEKYMDGTCR